MNSIDRIGSLFVFITILLGSYLLALPAGKSTSAYPNCQFQGKANHSKVDCHKSLKDCQKKDCTKKTCLKTKQKN